jgi:hypothetical protein
VVNPYFIGYCCSEDVVDYLLYSLCTSRIPPQVDVRLKPHDYIEKW